MEIIYIVGDGRSGSTVLDSILSNAEGTLSIGECYRFWNRFYKADTLCGCATKIEECQLWSRVDAILVQKIPDYDANVMWEQITYLLQFRQVPHIDEILKNTEWKSFNKTVELFYQTISKLSGKRMLIDSSKSCGWMFVLKALDFCDLKIIYLERRLPAVANSWKKKLYLPEYYDKKVLMPVKSNKLIVKNWLKIKVLLRPLKKENNCLFLRYEDFISDPLKKLDLIISLTGVELRKNNFIVKHNHSIAGNPMRNKTSSITIYKEEELLKNLTKIEWFCFSVIHEMSRLLL